MLAGFFAPRSMPCERCGASVAVSEQDAHACDEVRRLDFQLFQLREEIAAFERELAAYLASAVGRFELWYAERDRRRRLA